MTDLLISVVCFYAFFALAKEKVSHPVFLLFRGYFLFMALSTLVGGIIGHGFLYAFAPAWKFPGWAFSMIAMNLMERVMISYSRAYIVKGFAWFFSWLNIFELLTFAYFAFSTLKFKFVEWHTAYGMMVFVFGFSLFHYIRGNDRIMFAYFISAVFTTGLASFFFKREIGIDVWFNHVDISHTLLAVAAWLFYQGGWRMIDIIRYGDIHHRREP